MVVVMVVVVLGWCWVLGGGGGAGGVAGLRFVSFKFSDMYLKTVTIFSVFFNILLPSS